MNAAYAQYAGTPRHHHTWVAVIKDCDHGRVVWRGTTVHSTAAKALAEAEARLQPQLDDRLACSYGDANGIIEAQGGLIDRLWKDHASPDTAAQTSGVRSCAT
jgi:hypothetical protein